MSERDITQDNPREPTAAEQELIEAVGNMSERAIGQAWHPQTSNGALLFLRYGGFWGQLAARDVASELRRIEALARQYDSWPVLDGRSGEVRVATTFYQQSANRWRILDQGGLAATADGLIHVITGGPPSARAARELECGEDISTHIPEASYARALRRSVVPGLR